MADVTTNVLDPIQGFDVDVTVVGTNPQAAPILVGRFTSILVRMVNVTETYLELNQRMPRHLDGEINIVWQMERGMLNMGALSDTFGFFPPPGSPGGSGISRSNKIPRATRFALVFRVLINPATDFADPGMAQLNGQVYNNQVTTYMLSFCKVDTFSFGATSGRNIVANQWQGTAEACNIL